MADWREVEVAVVMLVKRRKMRHKRVSMVGLSVVFWMRLGSKEDFFKKSK